MEHTSTQNGRAELRSDHAAARAASDPHAADSQAEAVSLPPSTLFEPTGGGEFPEAPKLSRSVQEFFHAKLPKLAVDRQAIRKHVGQDGAVEAVKQHAVAAYASEPCRSNRRELAKRVLKAVKGFRQDLQYQLAREVDGRDTKTRTDRVLSVRDDNFWKLTTIPHAAVLGGSLLLFGFGFAAEFKNSVFLVTSSGLGFEDDPFGALCFTFPIVAGPFIALKFLERSLNPHGKRKFTQTLNKIATPIAVGTVGLFSWVIGKMHSEVDLFGSGTESWVPPLWALLGGEMVLLALMVTMLATFVKNSLSSFFEYLPEPNAEYVEVSSRVERLKSALLDTDVLRGQMLALLRRFEGERRMFVQECFGELQHQQHALLAKRAQVQLDPLDS